MARGAPRPAGDGARFGAAAWALHWATAVLVLVAFIYGPGGSEQRVYAAGRDFERQLHDTLGLCVFALVVLRVAWRFFDQRPATVPAARWMQIAPRVAESHALGQTIVEIHTWLGDTILWLAGLHALAGIYHHGALEDGVLASMLPRWFPIQSAREARTPSPVD